MGIKSSKERVAMPRLNTRIHLHQEEYVKNEVKRSKGALGEGELYRELIDLGIKVRRAK